MPGGWLILGKSIRSRTWLIQCTVVGSNCLLLYASAESGPASARETGFSFPRAEEGSRKFVHSIQGIEGRRASVRQKPWLKGLLLDRRCAVFNECFEASGFGASDLGREGASPERHFPG